MFFLYEVLGFVIIIFSPIIIWIRILNKKEDPKRFKEKLCFFTKKRPKGKLIWFHGSSVGEIMSIVPIIKKIEKNKQVKIILVTSSTLSSSTLISKFKFQKVIHQFFPLDTSYFSKKFLNYWRPSLAIFVESEIWPNTYFNLDKKKIPLILLNARITKKSFNKWLSLSNFTKNIFSKISLALPQNQETKKYLKILGTKSIKMAGNIKYFGEKKHKIKNSKLMKKFKNKSIWCAASTHGNEEIFIGKIHKKLKIKNKNLLTIIIPRHINRSENIIERLKNLNLETVKHSSSNSIKKSSDIYLVDTYGESSKFYDLTNLTFLGGSLIPHGGQNPLEPARSGNYILHGPYVDNFREVYSMLKKLKISCKINGISNAEKIIIKNIKYAQSRAINKKLFYLGNKILNKNLIEINKFI